MTAREPSAVEVIAEQLADLFGSEEVCWCEECRQGHAAHLLAAIRAMSPSEQADLIGGRVMAQRVVGPWREVQP